MNNVIYKSSPFTFLIRFVIPILLFIVAISGTIMSFMFNMTGESFCLNKIMLIATIWLTAIIFQLPFRLRKLEAGEDGVRIVTISSYELIKFEDIKWVSKFHWTCPLFSTIKYFNKETNSYKYISYASRQGKQKFFSDDTIAAFIKARIILENPEVQYKGPSNILNFILFSLFNISGLAIMILVCLNTIKSI